MNLDLSYENYRKGELSLQELTELIQIYTYNSVKLTANIDPAEFLIEFIPSIPRIILTYSPYRCGFYHYINKRIKWMKLRYYQESAATAARESGCMEYVRQQWQDSCENDNSPSFTEEVNENSLRLQEKRVLIAALKNCRNLTPSMISRLASFTGYSESQISHQIKLLMDQCDKKMDMREKLELRRNKLWFKLTELHEAILECSSPGQKELLSQKTVLVKKRLRAVQKELTEKHFGPKNQDIADVLNIPKGTVDSSLYYFKKQSREAFKKSPYSL